MHWRMRTAGLAFALLVGLSGTAVVRAQGRQTSTLTGTVADSTGAVLPGVTVTVTSDNLMGPQIAISDASGIYRFPSLPPGVYVVTAELQGFKTIKREGVRLPVGQTITIDLPMSVASLAETVTVTGESPVVDVKSSASPTNMSNEQLQNLPTARFQPDIINLAPGVSNNVAFGGTADSNALLMDGVDVSDPEGGSPWSFFNYNWISEVQVVSLGANAEYGEFTGVAANSIIRSGTNNFSGLGEYWTTRPGWVGANTGSLSADLQDKFKPRQIITNWDSTEQVGGPIVRDKLWFFTGFQYYKRVDRPAGFVGGDTSERDPRFLTKINWAPSSSTRLEGFFEKDKYDVKGRGASATRPFVTTTIEPSPEINWNVRFNWTINPSTLLEIKNGGYWGYYPVEPTPPASRSGPPGHFDGLTGMYSVDTTYYGKFTREPNVTSVTLTKYVDNFAGKNHEFKFGFEFEHAKVINEWGYPGNLWYYDYGGEPYLAYMWQGYVTTATTKRASLYAQDSWAVNDHLTINPGVRFNINRGSVPIKGTVFKTNPISPRIGFAWDVSADHKTVVRGHYGRYHDAVLASNYEFMDLSQQHPYSLVDVLAPGVFSDPLFTIDYSADVYGIDPNIKESYVDQYLVGVERELFPDFSMTVQYIKRNFRDFLGFVDTGSVYQPVQRQDPGPDGVLGTADDGAMLTVYDRTNAGNEFYQLTNPAGAYRDYNGFQIIGTKRYSHDWQLRASYTRSKTHGNVNNTFGNNAAGGDLGTGGVFANPNSAINADGPVAFDYTNQFKVDGTYHVPLWGGFNVSLVYQYRTGLAWGRRARVRGLTQGVETIRVEPRGTQRLPALKNLDFRIEKTWPLSGQRRTLGFYLDAFNLTNQGTFNSDSSAAVIDTSGSSYGQPNNWLSPRTLRAGIRFTF